MTHTETTARIAKTYADGSVDILTLPVDEARAHVAARTQAPDHYGLAAILVAIGRETHRWTLGAGWASSGACDNAAVEHPGFPCAHPLPA